ncbi:hypothetical protein GO013_13890 [Pseudodesulfovibrio sp. JC047]|uniref:HD domain-containing protein n=1 Tax=Pseudodesulfovibrio sp. JC047 TaxID=2683199 RepID=UPI0013D10235|nr:HD domain-containing protein [Pseudodesulfovibrio sp. JC047]NDV20503.1 hypothetical protein [Pseudodesulfovibrio sp. JC047]
MTHPTPKLYDFVDPADGECVRRETEDIFRVFFADYDGSIFKKAFEDVEQLFFGLYPGYRASNTKYHDFEHTCAVVLATARLIGGALVEGHQFAEKACLKGLLAALYHDVGLIQTEDDMTGTGAKYTIGHEERSIMFMRTNLAGVLSQADMDDIADCIRCTVLSMSPARISFSSDSMRTMGYFLGSADLLAQVADRYYLEKLVLLFEEFQEAKIPGYDSAMDLFSKTNTFYESVVRVRLDTEFNQVDRFMSLYFRKWREIDRDLYAEAIDRNLTYLKKILAGGVKNVEEVLARFRRGDTLTYSI